MLLESSAIQLSSQVFDFRVQLNSRYWVTDMTTELKVPP